MELIEKKLSELIPYANNPRKNDGAVDAVMESIKQCGYISPIVIDENNEVIAGHTCLKALKKMKIKTCKCVVMEGLTEEQKRKYRILDNKTSEFADWDLDLLNIELEGLDFEGFDFGFELAEEEEEKEIIEDEVPEVDETVEPTAKLGDIWQLGRHRLMCGDSTSVLDVEKFMDGKGADLLFTDPPYGYEYHSNMRTKSEKFDVLKNDDKILDFMPNAKAYVDGFVFVCTTWKVLDKWLPLFQKYYELTNMIIWDKGGGGMGDLEHTFSTDYEIILCSNNNAKLTGKRIGSVWNIGKDNANSYVHATQKPIKLAATAIESTTHKNDAVLDLFGGSGSTLIACGQMERTCYTMELDPKYVDVIIKRWEDFTGEKAVLLNG